MPKEKKQKQVKPKDQPNPNHKEDFLKVLGKSVEIKPKMPVK
ncbi:MAG TPA: hypothetical protein VGN20_06440 [Mucilaginibacter sp.]|jgi:hypothetical protein